MCSQVIAPIKNEAGEVCMYILNFEDTDAGPEVPSSAEPSSTVRFSKCNAHFFFLQLSSSSSSSLVLVISVESCSTFYQTTTTSFTPFPSLPGIVRIKNF